MDLLLLRSPEQDAAAVDLELPAGTLVRPALTCVPRGVLAERLPVALPALPAAGPAVLQVCSGAQVQAAASELRQLGLGAQLPGRDALQPPGVHLPADRAALVPEAGTPAPGGPAPAPPPRRGAGLPAAVRLPELHLAPAAPPGALALPQLPQAAPHLHLHLGPDHGALGRLGDAQPGPVRRRPPGAAGPPPAHSAELLRAEHVAVGGGSLRLRPAVGDAPPGAAGPVRRRPPPRPAPPQGKVQLRPLLHPLGPAGRDAAHTGGLSC